MKQEKTSRETSDPDARGQNRKTVPNKPLRAPIVTAVVALLALLIFGIVCMALCFLFAILANQRSGLVAAAIVIVYVNYLLFFDLHLIPKKYFWIELCVIAGLFLAACAIRFDYVLKFWYRIISLPSAISERSEQWVAAVNNM